MDGIHQLPGVIGLAEPSVSLHSLGSLLINYWQICRIELLTWSRKHIISSGQALFSVGLLYVWRITEAPNDLKLEGLK
jgi:hypothetical protein